MDPFIAKPISIKAQAWRRIGVSPSPRPSCRSCRVLGDEKCRGPPVKLWEDRRHQKTDGKIMENHPEFRIARWSLDTVRPQKWGEKMENPLINPFKSRNIGMVVVWIFYWSRPHVAMSLEWWLGLGGILPKWTFQGWFDLSSKGVIFQQAKFDDHREINYL